MKKNSSPQGIIFILFLLCFSITLPARFIPERIDFGKRMLLAGKPDSLRNKNIFQSIGITPVIEAMSSKAVSYIQSYDFNNVSYDTINYRAESAVTLIAVTYDFRYNLYDYRDIGSVSASIPAAFSMNFYERSSRMGSLTFPVFVDVNYGMHSTFNNIDRFGGHIGVGYQAIFGGVFGGGGSRGEMLLWTQPVVRAGGKFPFKNKNCFFDVYWGFGKKHINFLGYDGYNGNVPLNENVYSKLYFKAVFGWLINYND
jgi:hypothetical protein